MRLTINYTRGFRFTQDEFQESQHKRDHGRFAKVAASATPAAPSGRGRNRPMAQVARAQEANKTPEQIHTLASSLRYDPAAYTNPNVNRYATNILARIDAARAGNDPATALAAIDIARTIPRARAYRDALIASASAPHPVAAPAPLRLATTRITDYDGQIDGLRSARNIVDPLTRITALANLPINPAYENLVYARFSAMQMANSSLAARGLPTVPMPSSAVPVPSSAAPIPPPPRRDTPAPPLSSTAHGRALLEAGNQPNHLARARALEAIVIPDTPENAAAIRSRNTALRDARAAHHALVQRQTAPDPATAQRAEASPSLLAGKPAPKTPSQAAAQFKKLKVPQREYGPAPEAIFRDRPELRDMSNAFVAGFSPSHKSTGTSVSNSSGGEYSIRHDVAGEGSVTRNIDFNKKHVYHAYQALSSQAQGNGTAKRNLEASVLAYKAAGIETVGVTASLSVGAYAWAKFGFVPKQSSWDSLRGMFAHSINADPNSSRYNPKEAAELLAILTSSKPKAIWALADHPKGKQFLLGQTWSGTLDLNDAQSYNRCLAYCRKKPKEEQK